MRCGEKERKRSNEVCLASLLDLYTLGSFPPAHPGPVSLSPIKELHQPHHCSKSINRPPYSSPGVILASSFHNITPLFVIPSPSCSMITTYHTIYDIMTLDLFSGLLPARCKTIDLFSKKYVAFFLFIPDM